ncbi:hypothetical protein [Dyella sp.]|jgi:hypothetical protein|nr:hypothetical protein [Dyella sp.]HTC27769.1 hypothetical protein [Dyella sp.]
MSPLAATGEGSAVSGTSKSWAAPANFAILAARPGAHQPIAHASAFTTRP